MFNKFLYCQLIAVSFLVSFANAAAKPNIVLIVSDDQGYGDISAYDHPAEVATVNLDRISKTGTRFSNGYASAYVCAPSRAGLITGRYQQRFGFYSGGDSRIGLPLSEVTLATLLKTAGYKTGVFGKWHLGLEKQYHPLSRGFDEFYGFLGHGAHDYFELKADDLHNGMWRNWDRIDDTGYLTDNLGREAAAFIRRHHDEPFFCYLPFNAVHWPLQAPQEDVQRYRNDNPERNIYLAMLDRMDQAVGVVLDELESQGLTENTLVLFMSDNGGSKKVFANNGRLRDFKQSTYEGGIRVPFMVSWPARVEAGKVIETPVIALDLLPTICQAAGITISANRKLDGKSLLPLLQGEAVKQLHEYLYWDGDEGRYAIRNGDWKLVVRNDTVGLYNLAVDIGEEHDLKEVHPEKLQQLQEQFTAWRKQCPPTLREQQTAKKKPVPASTQRRSGTPNVLLVICDDLNRHVTTSGYQHIKTPSLEALATRGMTFNRAYCQYPVCGPSRASFLSGVYPETTGILDNKSDIRNVRPELKSLPQLFKENGYWTGGVGKVFHGRLDHGDTAWHEYHQFQNSWNPVLKPIQDAFEKEHGSIDLAENQKAWRATLKENRVAVGGQSPPGYGPTDMTDAQHRDGKNVRQVAKWINEQTHGDKPFFITCGIHKPHVPFWAPRKYFDMYPADKIPVQPVPLDDLDDIPPRALVHRYEAFGFERGVENMKLRRDYMQAYHACITFIDAQIGLLWDALDEQQLWEDTIVIVMSDHGYHLGEHFLWGKVTLFEECARVPLIVHVPGRTTAGSSTEGLVELVDLLPTLCSLCDITIPNYVQGTSVELLLEDPSLPGKRQAYTVVTRGAGELGLSVRVDRWRYADWGDSGKELYDLRNDPGEFRNQYGEPRLQQVQRMQRALENVRTPLRPVKPR